MKIDKAGKPLSPYRVLDLTDDKGLLCGKILGDLGADVIKIERPGGDPARKKPPFYHNIPHPEKSLYWFVYNTNKRGITLDIETEDGRQLFKRLIKGADFIIESYPPGYMDRLGLGYDALSKINPKTIMTSITPYGQLGPYRDWKGSDITYMAMSCIMNISGDPDRAPLRISAEQAYPQAGSQAAAGTMIAHYHRLMTGEGQHVDVSVHEAAVWSVAHLLGDWIVRGLYPGGQRPAKREGIRVMRGTIAPRIIWTCKDGYVAWRIFTGVLGRRTQAMVAWMISEGIGEQLKNVKWEEYDFSKITQDELESWEEYFSSFFMTKTKGELHNWSIKRGMTLYPVSTTKDLVDNPQLKHRGYWVQLKHPELGEELTYIGEVFKTSEYHVGPSFRAPLIGEHNEEIYIKELGLSSEMLVMLASRGVV